MCYINLVISTVFGIHRHGFTSLCKHFTYNFILIQKDVEIEDEEWFHMFSMEGSSMAKLSVFRICLHFCGFINFDS